MNLENLSDLELRTTLHSLVKYEREIVTVVLRHLCEIDRRKVFVDYGYETLFSYVRKELGYSDAEAQVRIEAMRMLRDISGSTASVQSARSNTPVEALKPAQVIESALASGKLNITHLAQVKRASRRDRLPIEKSIELLNQITGLSTRESEVQIARACQREIPRKKLVLELSDEQYSLWMKARAELLHHGTSPEVIFQALCESALRESGINPNRGKSDPAPRNPSENDPVAAQAVAGDPSVVVASNSRLRPIHPNRRTVSVARRKSLLQKHCEYPGCTSRLGLQIDHKTPWSQGGKTAPENLQVLCVNHHARKSFQECG